MNIDVFPGIGKALSKRLGSYKIKTLGEVLNSAHMLLSWGRVGKDLVKRISGTDNEQVNAHHNRKSIPKFKSEVQLFENLLK